MIEFKLLTTAYNVKVDFVIFRRYVTDKLFLCPAGNNTAMGLKTKILICAGTGNKLSIKYFLFLSRFSRRWNYAKFFLITGFVSKYRIIN